MKLPDVLNWTKFQKRIEKRDLLLLGGVGFLLFILVLYGVWFRPRVRNIQGLRRNLHALQVQRKDAETLGNISYLKEEINEMERRFEGKFFKRNEIPRALESLKDHIAKYRLEAISLQPQWKETLPSFALAPNLTVDILPLYVHLKGEYRAMGAFLGTLRELPFLTTVEALQMGSPQAAYPKVEAHLTLSLYLEKEQGAVRGK